VEKNRHMQYSVVGVFVGPVCRCLVGAPTTRRSELSGQLFALPSPHANQNRLLASSRPALGKEISNSWTQTEPNTPTTKSTNTCFRYSIQSVDFVQAESTCYVRNIRSNNYIQFRTTFDVSTRSRTNRYKRRRKRSRQKTSPTGRKS
jgi:hypothetical protein